MLIPILLNFFFGVRYNYCLCYPAHETTVILYIRSICSSIASQSGIRNIIVLSFTRKRVQYILGWPFFFLIGTTECVDCSISWFPWWFMILFWIFMAWGYRRWWFCVCVCVVLYLPIYYYDITSTEFFFFFKHASYWNGGVWFQSVYNYFRPSSFATYW